jgi:hypothetical protein
LQAALRFHGLSFKRQLIGSSADAESDGVGFVNSAVGDSQGESCWRPEGVAAGRTGSSRRRWPLRPVS